MLHIGATTWHLTIVPRTSATRCAARGVIRGLTAGQRAGFESPVNVTIPATISSNASNFLLCFVFFVFFHDRCQIILLFHQITETVLVTCYIWIV